jgi:hypothetical protein
MATLLFSPVFFYGQIVLVLAVALLLGTLLTRSGRPRAPGASYARLRLGPLLERQEARAVALGWTLDVWLWVRAASVATGLIAGVVIGTPVVIVGCTVVGLFVVPFLLGPYSDKRRLQMERALVDQTRAVVDLIRTSNQTLDEALTDAGQNPLPLLRRVMSPLADTQQSIRSRLIEVDRRALSPIANRICADLLLSLDTSPEAVVVEATEVLIPQYESDLTIQERNHAIAQGSRQAGYIVAGLMAFMFVVVMHVDNFRAAYARPLGQVVLVIVAGMVMLIFWIIGQLTPRSQWVRWNLAEIKNQLERRYA